MTVAFVKLADSQIYMADHYTKSTRFHDADNDKVVCRICMDAIRVSGTVIRTRAPNRRSGNATGMQR